MGEKVIYGKEKFLEIVKTYEVCDDQLLKFLDDNAFYNAPASTMTSLHNAFDGGLVDHLMTVTRWALAHNETNKKLNPNLYCAPNSVARVSLLHGIGRTKLYKPNPSEWHRKNLGKMYEFNEELTSLTASERALYYVWAFGGLKLTEEEYQAISNAEKDISTDMAAKWHSEPLALLLRQQIEWAIMDEKYKNKN